MNMREVVVTTNARLRWSAMGEITANDRRVFSVNRLICEKRRKAMVIVHNVVGL